jgi:hypothetical protein
MWSQPHCTVYPWRVAEPHIASYWLSIAAVGLLAGNLLGIIVLAWAGACGHTPIALCGGATGRVGDPSGRSTERPVLTEAEIQGNVDGRSSWFI